MENIGATQSSFSDYLFKNQQNRKILLLAGLAIVVQFSVFKYFYPYASFIHGDSFLYLKSANDNSDINTYMIGYSRFLRFFSVFTNSDTALTAFQYVFFQSSILLLLFTLFYFYNPGKLTRFILLCFMIFNPLLLYMANLVSSDCIFASLSLIWFSLLLWIIHRPSTRIIIWHTLVLFFVFTVRYNALIYPFVAALAFWLSALPIRKKIIGFASGMLLCLLFVGFTTYKYKQLTGYWQYSPFSGWQLANNAMYAYRYVDKADRKPVPLKFRTLDNMIREYYDSTRDLKKHPLEGYMASTFYMWSPGLPLYKYQNLLFKKDTSASSLKKWATMGPYYKDYGLYIIRQYPWKFLRYFAWPNANKYYAPPVEFLQMYNSSKDSVALIAKTWFGYKDRFVKTRTKDLNIWILNFYPILSGIINVAILLGLFSFIFLNGFRQNDIIKKGILLGGIIWLLNAVFTIFASSAALRFQSFPILLSTIFAALLIDWLGKIAHKTQVQPDINISKLPAGPALAMETHNASSEVNTLESQQKSYNIFK
jgi:hypothetical protein